MATDRIVGEARAVRAEIVDRLQGVRSLVDEGREIHRAARGLARDADLPTEAEAPFRLAERDLENAAKRLDAIMADVENVPTPPAPSEPQPEEIAQ